MEIFYNKCLRNAPFYITCLSQFSHLKSFCLRLDVSYVEVPISLRSTSAHVSACISLVRGCVPRDLNPFTPGFPGPIVVMSFLVRGFHGLFYSRKPHQTQATKMYFTVAVSLEKQKTAGTNTWGNGWCLKLHNLTSLNRANYVTLQVLIGT